MQIAIIFAIFAGIKFVDDIRFKVESEYYCNIALALPGQFRRRRHDFETFSFYS